MLFPNTNIFSNPNPMKDFFKILLIVVVSLVAGAYMHKCQSPHSDSPPGTITDTTTYIDTIPYIEPAPVSTTPIGFISVTVPAPATHGHSTSLDSLPDIRADTTTQICATISADNPDSLTLQLPITQNVYEDEDYTAYVSGVYPRLDSIFVYPKREVVTIKKPPKRWHIGPTIGFGVTPKGLQPYIGISVTYSIISF